MTDVKEITMYECSMCETLHSEKTLALECCTLPTPLEEPDIDRLRGAAEGYIRGVLDDPYSDDTDDVHYCFEALIMGIYGPDIFKWVNERKE